MNYKCLNKEPPSTHFNIVRTVCNGVVVSTIATRPLGHSLYATFVPYFQSIFAEMYRHAVSIDVGRRNGS
jgi:hypothetical protein